MKRAIILFLGVIFFQFTQAQQSQKPVTDKSSNRHFNINKSIDVYSSVLKELDMFYVDSIDVDSLVQNNVQMMLNGLDPYTEYYPEDKMDDLRFMTTGEYAGIGAIISQKNGGVIINEPYEGMPAAKAGLKAGDQILEIDGKDLRKAPVSKVSENLKGTPGTTLSILIQRPGEAKPRIVKVIREKITIHPVTYSTVMKNNIGYLHFSGFTENSSAEAKQTILDLKNKGAKSLIMDLRGNGGGILDEAVNIVNFFVPKGKEIVSTKGKIPQRNRVYKTLYNSMDEMIPLVILTDTGSASASEIVAGSLQDLDRAVIIGNRTFGKGLVQEPRQLPYNGSMKLTIAKYYIPSGRLIQKLDYSHRNADGSIGSVPDSLTNIFKTFKGRLVRDGGGITPDIIINQSRPNTIVYYLTMENIIFDYVTDWVLKHKSIDSPDKFNLSDTDYEDFKKFVKTKKFNYDQMSARLLKQLKEVMKFEGYMDTASEEFKALEAKLVPNLDRDLDLAKDDIRNQISNEIIQRYYFKKGVLIHTLASDKVLDKAIEILQNPAQYQAILSPRNDNK